MDGLCALKEALSKDPASLTASIAAERNKVRERVDRIKASQASLSAAYSLGVTECLEEQNSLNGQTLCQHSSRPQELRAQIETLTSQLQSELNSSSVQNQTELQKFEDAIAHFTTQDEEEFTKHVRSLLDFFESYSFES